MVHAASCSVTLLELSFSFSDASLTEAPEAFSEQIFIVISNCTTNLSCLFTFLYLQVSETPKSAKKRGQHKI